MAGQTEARAPQFAYTESEVKAARAAAERSLAEDLDDRGDITTRLFGEASSAAVIEAAFVPRENGILAGARVADEVFTLIDKGTEIRWLIGDGEQLVRGRAAAVLAGSADAILAGERSALNSLCHLSGIATMAHRFVSLIELASPDCRLRDTRKTHAGLRILEKAAVRAGGGINHRLNLSDAVLIKDNHIAAFLDSRMPDRDGDLASSELEKRFRDLVVAAREQYPGVEIEIEADTIGVVEAAVAAGADTVLCDNMSPPELGQAVEVARGRCRLEASGGVTLENVSEVAATGVDYIAVGAVTHSAPALDIGLDLLGLGSSKGNE
ncbi:MAG: nicotinate-nucleotide diphosphorylase (carboxylating) [Acidobacteria bacterium]|nr:MAG: nicotinate-nucleotide diphosphorylase (carboxylating) [Acidobacteriota bacterium]